MILYAWITKSPSEIKKFCKAVSMQTGTGSRKKKEVISAYSNLWIFDIIMRESLYCDGFCRKSGFSAKPWWIFLSFKFPVSDGNSRPKAISVPIYFHNVFSSTYYFSKSKNVMSRVQEASPHWNKNSTSIYSFKPKRVPKNYWPSPESERKTLQQTHRIHTAKKWIKSPQRRADSLKRHSYYN